MCVCVCVGLGSGCGPSQFPPVLFVMAQLAGAAAFGLPPGRRGVAPAPQFQLYVRCAGHCRARGGSRAPVFVYPSGAPVAQRGCVMCVWCVGLMPVQQPGWGIAVYGSFSVVGLCWWDGVCCVCLVWFLP